MPNEPQATDVETRINHDCLLFCLCTFRNRINETREALGLFPLGDDELEERRMTNRATETADLPT